MAKIDIIIPAYNVEHYISNCLKSILTQDFQDFRIIIIEDKSQDKTLEVINRFLRIFPDKIKLIINDKNKKTATCRNIGLAASDAEYVTFVDADDYLDKNILTKINNIIDLYHPDIISFELDLVFHGMKANFLGTRKKKASEDKLIDAKTYKKHIYEERNSATGKVIKRDVITNKFPDGLKWEDFAFIVPIEAKVNTVYLLRDTGYYYNINPFGTTTNDMLRVPPRLLDIFTCCDEIDANIPLELSRYYKDELSTIKILNCIKRARDLILTRNLTKEEKVLLANYIVNLTRVREGDYETLPYHIEQMEKSRFYRYRFNKLEQLLDPKLQKETNEFVLKKKINEIIKKQD